MDRFMDGIQNINAGHIALLVLVVMSILRRIAPRTESKVDDRIVTAFDTGSAWLAKNAPGIFAQIEAQANGGAFTGGAAKLMAYLWKLNIAHLEDHGTPLPVEMIDAAKRAAAELDATDKNMKALAGLLPDPPAAPASK